MIAPPSAEVGLAARKRLDAVAKPTGSLGRLEDLAVWISACQGVCPPRLLERVRAVVLAGDHGVSHVGVSAYPREVTAAMMRAFAAGIAGASVLARQHGVALRVLDLGVDDDLAGLPAALRQHKVRRSSGAIHLTDGLSHADTNQALAAGVAIADEEIAAGADLLIVGDLGIGNTTPAAALIAATFAAGAREVTGRGTGLDADQVRHKTAVIAQALTRVGDRARDPMDRLSALGSADLAAGVGFVRRAAECGVPVLLDGVVSVAVACLAENLDPGVLAWCAAGHRSTEPAQRLALDRSGLAPVLDLGLRLGEGSGAIAAVPLLRSAVLLVREMGLLDDLATPPH